MIGLKKLSTQFIIFALNNYKENSNYMQSKKLRYYFFIILAIFSITLSSQSNRDIQFRNKKNNYRIDSLISEIRLPLDSAVIGFEQIGEAIGDKRIVMIGEEMHCVEEFNLIRLKLIEYLVENKGFEVVLWEANQLQSTIFNVIKDTITDVKFLTQTLHGVWWDSVNLQTMRYIQMKNLDFAGFDYQKSGFYNPVLISQIYLNIDSTIGVQKQILDSTFQNLLMSIQENKKNNYKNTIDYKRQKTIIEDIRSSFVNNAHAIIAKINNRMNHLNDSIQLNLIYSLYLQTKQELNYVQSISEINNYAVSFDYRDSIMSENLVWFIEKKYPQKKIIVVAANAHITKNKHQKHSKNQFVYQVNPMCSNLPKNILSESYIIGTIGLSGTTHYPFQNIKKLKKPMRNSIEAILMKTNFKVGFINIPNSTKNQDTKWICLATKYNANGLFNKKIVLANHYDGLIFFNEINATDSWLFSTQTK